MNNNIWKSVLLAAVFVASLFYKQEVYASESIDRYVRFTQVDPLFAWPGVNLEHMNTAISLLEQSRAEIVALVGKQYNDQQKKRVEQTLYPTAYLSEMVALERLRRGLFQNVPLEQVHSYQAQLERTIGAYQSYLNVLIPALLRTSREQDYKGLEYHFGRSSFGHFLSGIRSYRAQSDSILETSLSRWACVTEDGPECIDPNWPEISKPAELAVDEAIFTSDTAKIISAMRMNSNVPGQPVKPQWAVTTSHQCFIYRPEVYYFLWEFASGYDAPVWRADVVNDILVHDHRVTETTGSRYEKKLNSLGADGYLYQSFTNHYTCPDIASDTGLIRSMVAVYRVLGGFEWSQIGSQHSDMIAQYEELQNKAAAIIKKPYASEYPVQDFMFDLSVMMNVYEPEDLIALWGGKQQGVFEQMMLAYRLQTPDLSRDIMNLVYSNIAIGDYVAHAPWGYIEELLFTRNAPELLLGGSNPSIIYENYPQVEHHRKETSPRLRSYKSELAKEYTPAEFTEILIKGVNAEAALSALQGRSYLQNLFPTKSGSD